MHDACCIKLLDYIVAKKAPYACGNFHACAFTRFQKPQQLGWARIACSCHVCSEPGLIAVASAVASCGRNYWGGKKAVHPVRHCKEVGLQEWPLAGRATVPRVLYGISPCMSLCQRTVFSKTLPAPACVALTIHTFRTVELQVVVLFGKRWELVTIARFGKHLFANMHHHVHAVARAPRKPNVACPRPDVSTVDGQWCDRRWVRNLQMPVTQCWPFVDRTDSFLHLHQFLH